MRYLLALTLACTFGVGVASADDPPPEETTETSVVICWTDPIPEECRVDYCDPLGIDQVAPHCDPTYCEEGPNHLPCEPSIGDPLGPIDNPDLPEVPEEGQEAMEDPAPIIAPRAVPITSGTLPYTG